MLNIQLSNHNFSWIDILPLECLDNILSYLSYKHLLKFETLSKEYQNLTNYRWQKLGIQDGFNFGWKICHEKEEQEGTVDHRRNYLLSLAVLTYQRIRKQFYQKEVKDRFDLIRKNDFSFDFYITRDLASKDKKLRKSKEKQMEEQAFLEDSSGGEYLMMGLLELNKYLDYFDNESINAAKILLSKAVENGVTNIHPFICSTLGDSRKIYLSLNYDALLAIFYRDLALLTQEKGNEEGLKSLFKFHLFSYAINQHVIRKLSFEALIEIEKELCVKGCINECELLDQLYQKVIAIDQDKTPSYVLGCAALVKLKLSQVRLGTKEDTLKQAEVLHTKAMIAYGNNVPTRILEGAAFIKDFYRKG